MAQRYSLSAHIEAINQHDPDAFVRFYAPDAVIHDPQYPEPLRGHEAIRRDMADFVRSFPDLAFQVTTVLERDNVVAFEGIARGTQTGPLAGPAGELAPTNRPMEMPFAGFIQVNPQGLVAEDHRYYDLAGLLRQLGVGG